MFNVDRPMQNDILSIFCNNDILNIIHILVYMSVNKYSVLTSYIKIFMENVLINSGMNINMKIEKSNRKSFVNDSVCR